MEAYLFDIEPVVPVMRIAICQTITTILDSYFFDIKIRKKLLELKNDEDKKNAIAMIFMYASMWAFGGITNQPESKKLFEGIIRNKIEGLPKEGSPLD